MPRLKPHQVQKALDTAEREIGNPAPRKLSSEGKAKLAPTLVEPVERPVDKEKLEMLAFAAQKLTIVINPSNQTNAEDPVYVGNSGDPLWLKRNVEHTIERRFVESLARAKVTTYSQREDIAPNGVKHILNIPHTACRYDFRVVHDPHPRGGEWLKAVLLEA